MFLTIANLRVQYVSATLALIDGDNHFNRISLNNDNTMDSWTEEYESRASIMEQRLDLLTHRNVPTVSTMMRYTE